MPARKLPLLAVLLTMLAVSAGCVSLPQLTGGERVGPNALPGAGQLVYDILAEEAALQMDDGVELRATVFTPQGQQGETFPGVVVVHGWGGDRNGWPYSATGGGSRTATAALAEDLAAHGFVTLAYDVRGFGESGGVTQLAGEREIQDLRNVLSWMTNETPVIPGAFGVTGFSYGGGHSYLIGLKDARVRAVVPWYGWTDLAQGLVPDRVPKHGWATLLLGYGLPSARGEYDPQLYDWYVRGFTRTDVDTVVEGLRARSVRDAIANYTIPILMIEGLGETLFPQSWEAYRVVQSPKMLYAYNGGHGSFDAQAWELTKRWFGHWLRGEDNGVLQEPAVRVFAPWSNSAREYATYPAPGTEDVVFHLTAEGALSPEPGTSAAAFPFVNTQASGRADDPAALTDASPQPWRSTLPVEARALPAGEVARFSTEPFEDAMILFGTPALTANFTSRSADLQFAARLYDVAPDGRAILLSRGGTDLSPVTAGEPATGAVDLTRHHWRIEPGHRLVLDVGASDVTYTQPLPRPFAAELLVGPGHVTELRVPLLPAGTE